MMVAMCLLTINTAFAEVVPQTLTIKKLSNNLSSLDGKCNDAQWNEVEAINITRNFCDENPSVTAWFKMFYTDEFLYVYVDVTDNVHAPVYSGKADNEKIKDVHHFYDKVELYFDVNDNLKDGYGPTYQGIEGGGGYIPAGHYQFAPWFEEDGYDYQFLMQGLLYSTMSDQAMVCYSLKNNYTDYGIEFEFPLNKFMNNKDEYMSAEAFEKLASGMGFDVTVVDNDSDGQGRKRLVWCSNESEAYYNMDACGTVQFGMTSGIVDVNTDSNSSTNNYNVLGQRVSKNATGICINNGKKIIKY